MGAIKHLTERFQGALRDKTAQATDGSQTAHISKQHGNIFMSVLAWLFIIYVCMSLISRCGENDTQDTKTSDEATQEWVTYTPPEAKTDKPSEECISAQHDFRNAEHELGDSDNGVDAVRRYNAAFSRRRELNCPDEKILDAVIERRLSDAKAIIAEAREMRATEREALSMLNCTVSDQNGLQLLFVTGTDETGTYAINGTARSVAARMGWIDGYRNFSHDQMRLLLELGLTKCDR